GVQGFASGSTDQGIGVFGQAQEATSATIGVYGIAQSPAGAGGRFENLDPGGGILGLYSNRTQVAHVAANRSVHATSFAGSGAGLRGITSAAQATALAANGSNCTGNNFALGVDASGNAECAQPAFSNLSGTATVAQGGTNATTAAGARSNLGAAASGANTD